jgi:hypothetical protein
MGENQNAGRPSISFEELAYSNMLIVQALVELLSEKGLLGNAEVMERVKKLRRETDATFPESGKEQQGGGAV